MTTEQIIMQWETDEAEKLRTLTISTTSTTGRAYDVFCPPMQTGYVTTSRDAQKRVTMDYEGV